MQDATPQNWQAVLDDSDEEAFRQLVEPYTERLIGAARGDLAYYIEQGRLHEEDLTPEEVTGEALIYAWEHRAGRPEKMSLLGWLLGTQHRVLRSLVTSYVQYRQDKALSLDEQIPPDALAQGRQERRQYGLQPDLQITWEDVMPGSVPVDIEAPLFTNRDTFTLDPDSRHVVMMHDEFEMDLSEVAFTMNRSVRETAQLLEQARTALTQQAPRTEETPPAGETE